MILAPLAVTLAFSDGIGHAHLAGWYDDEAALTLRLAYAITGQVAVDAGFSEDLERVELGVHAGVRVRPACAAEWLYLRGDVALVGASHLGSSYDLTAGAGGWYRVMPWLAVEGEIDVVARVGELDAQAIRAVAGVAIASPRFWHHI